jgi:hypothetical protein
MVMGLDRTQKPRLTVLVRTSSNLSDRPTKLPSWVSCERVASWQWYEHGSRGMFIVRSLYQVTSSGDIEDFMCVTITEIFIPLSFCLSMALQPFVGPWLLFQFLNLLHSRQDSLDGGSAHRKATTCAEDSTNTEKTHTDIHASSGIWTHDPSVWAGEDSSCLRPLGHCDWLQRSLVCVNQTGMFCSHTTYKCLINSNANPNPV